MKGEILTIGGQQIAMGESVKIDLEMPPLYTCLLYTSPSPRDRG